MLSIAQAEPSQVSAKAVPVPLWSVYVPTAVQAVAELHDTLRSKLAFAALGAGVLWIVQPEPSHRSASGTALPPPAVVEKLPTAVQASEDGQEIPLSALVAAPGGLGVLCTTHAAPSHRSASGVVPPRGSFGTINAPTVIHAVAEGHETSLRLNTGLGVFGVGSVIQLEPIQRSTSAT